MWENIGGKVKGLAQVGFWILATCWIIYGLILMQKTVLLGIAIGAAGVVASWIGSWALYAIGTAAESAENAEHRTREVSLLCDELKALNKKIDAMEKSIKANDAKTSFADEELPNL